MCTTTHQINEVIYTIAWQFNEEKDGAEESVMGIAGAL